MTGRDGTVEVLVVIVVVVVVVDILVAVVLAVLVDVVLVDVVLLIVVVGLCTRTASSLATPEQPVKRDTSRARLTRRLAIRPTVPALFVPLPGWRCGRVSMPSPRADLSHFRGQ